MGHGAEQSYVPQLRITTQPSRARRALHLVGSHAITELLALAQAASDPRRDLVHDTLVLRLVQKVVPHVGQLHQLLVLGRQLSEEPGRASRGADELGPQRACARPSGAMRRAWHAARAKAAPRTSRPPCMISAGTSTLRASRRTCCRDATICAPMPASMGPWTPSGSTEIGKSHARREIAGDGAAAGCACCGAPCSSCSATATFEQPMSASPRRTVGSHGSAPPRCLATSCHRGWRDGHASGAWSS